MGVCYWFIFKIFHSGLDSPNYNESYNRETFYFFPQKLDVTCLLSNLKILFWKKWLLLEKFTFTLPWAKAASFFVSTDAYLEDFQFYCTWILKIVTFLLFVVVQKYTYLQCFLGIQLNYFITCKRFSNT